MIVTLTLNPSVDRTVEVETLARGEVTRAMGGRVDPGGKGINVSRALATHGLPTRAVVTVGGAEGEHLVTLLRDTGIEIVPVRIRGAIRSNITIVEPDGTTTKINEPGAELSTEELNSVFDAVVAAVESADWLVASGSLPPGTPPDVYADLVRSLSDSGTRVAIDTSGPAFEAVLAAGPTLVKPNRDELAEATGVRLVTIADVVEAACRLRDRGAGAVLASLGADGAVLVDDDGALHGQTPVVSPLSSVGAGDAMLAGFLAGGGAGASALTQGLAWGAAAVLQPGSGMPSPEDIDLAAVRLERHETTRRDLFAMPP
jgi:1-phosphofructokinase